MMSLLTYLSWVTSAELPNPEMPHTRLPRQLPPCAICARIIGIIVSLRDDQPLLLFEHNLLLKSNLLFVFCFFQFFVFVLFFVFFFIFFLMSNPFILKIHQQSLMVLVPTTLIWLGILVKADSDRRRDPVVAGGADKDDANNTKKKGSGLRERRGLP